MRKLTTPTAQATTSSRLGSKISAKAKPGHMQMPHKLKVQTQSLTCQLLSKAYCAKSTPESMVVQEVCAVLQLLPAVALLPRTPAATCNPATCRANTTPDHLQLQTHQCMALHSPNNLRTAITQRTSSYK